MWMCVVLLSCLTQMCLTKTSHANVVFILSDDQDLTLGGLMPMTKTQKLIANEGTTFLNAFVTTPICCPSRSSILTGKYMHNHHTVNNSVSGECSSFSWQQKNEKETYAARLHAVGYKTFYAGKYLNQYGKHSDGGPKHVPPGWDWWLGLVGNSRYYNYTLSINGSASYFEEDYLTGIITDYALQFLQQKEITQKHFLMVLSPPAPHAPFIPSPKYKGRFKHVRAPRTPNFNIPVHKDRHWLLRMQPSPLPNTLLPTLDHIYQHRWETLLSVDDMVEAVVTQLDRLNVLNNTYIIYTSDHGYHIGQFGLPWDKRQPYECDIRIPLLVRGPGVPRKSISFQPVLNIDFAPTFIDMAGLPPVRKMDGISFLPALRNTDVGLYTGRTFLVQYKGEGSRKTISPECILPEDDSLSECSADAACKCQDSRNNTYMCIRQLTPYKNFLFCRFYDSEGFTEAYDLHKDPYQLYNIASLLNARKVSEYEELMKHLAHCTGYHCSLNM